ncbi:SDR family oxidoreductase [Allosphingosinicella flava]|uniref:SDR family oxidoreductase n=1 Tax=Allosphingosinicella flava TaxID=2771430 RepID=A0A7T2LMK1_9SPHN|nr:SDR family oxidoreductase [Sphingosinicella flava]QPQ55177.1 SDR family oxidoreductase [Sphingosinicella flava]
MRILLLGAGGFIGRHIMSELIAHGHDVIAVVRRDAGLSGAFPNARFRSMDLAAAIDPSAWTEPLRGVDIVINAAGVLRGSDMVPVHVAMPGALHEAALAAGVRRVVLISAISARPDVDTDYAQSKLEGEAALKASGVPWTILRPSLVYGDGSYGGTSLLRGMAGLPWRIPLPSRGDFPFTPIHAADLARSVRQICEDAAFTGQILEPVGPETLSLADLLARYRAWLGFGQARFLHIPIPAMRLFGRIGDVMSSGPVSTNSLVQLMAGNAGSSADFAKAMGWMPRSLGKALAARPAEVQDRWHARLFFLAPAIKAVLVFLWLASALLGFVYGRAATEALAVAAGLAGSWVSPLQMGSSLLDLAVAALLLFDKNRRFITLAQLVVVAGYTIMIGTLLPHLWADPFGALLKNIPILALILVHGVIGDRR